ncbi:unnamed protein product [Caenorhabditis angaria]|uniref:Hydroxymethylglutaryl-CoA synthase n=1 Tax=Caenorhabditis angaria TaxID=860376 RepID=A0A9P1IVL5_9PELO|nr:unnamed protein product [Caenorhabditis angaria]
MRVQNANPLEDVGIDAIEFYFPRNYVDQADLEQFGGVSSGKHTIGLGQQEMGFCADNEDIVSISRTVTRNLLKNYKISPDTIGFLAVGTETLIDKSKSVKTALMDLFGSNTDIEGVDIKNACYGGAQALLHAIDWVHVNYAAEKRSAIVVIADIAVYEAGPARCTGGAGAIAFLIRPNSAVPIDRVFASCHMKNTWDFYKPISSNVSEYPRVDGSLSLASYLEAARTSYTTFKTKAAKIADVEVTLNFFDAIFLHSPFTKMVQKGLAVMNYVDVNNNLKNSKNGLNENDRADMAKMVELSNNLWKRTTDPYLTFNRRIGNMYTPSLFAQLLAFLASDDCISENNEEKNILFFAYGSGLASAVFPGRVRQTESLSAMRKTSIQALQRLDERKKYSAEEFTEVLSMRERFLAKDVPTEPESLSPSLEISLFPETCYLEHMDSSYRRKYAIFEEVAQNGISNGNGNGH